MIMQGGVALEFIISDAAMNVLRNNELGRLIRIKPKSKTWGGITYEIVPGELTAGDEYYEVKELVFIISKEEAALVCCLEIDYIEDWWGKEFVIVAGY